MTRKVPTSLLFILLGIFIPVMSLLISATLGNVFPFYSDYINKLLSPGLFPALWVTDMIYTNNPAGDLDLIFLIFTAIFNVLIYLIFGKVLEQSIKKQKQATNNPATH